MIRSAMSGIEDKTCEEENVAENGTQVLCNRKSSTKARDSLYCYLNEMTEWKSFFFLLPLLLFQVERTL